MNVRGLISIFALPQEIDDLQNILYNLKRNMAYLPANIRMDIDITFCLSDEVTDWENSTLPREYFLEKFDSLRPLMDWSDNPKIQIEYGKNILGCVSQRRHSTQYLSNYDFTIWMDCDMFFPDSTILTLASSYVAAKDSKFDNVIITPQFVRQWDSSWDILVHDDYKDFKLMYHEDADIIQDSLYDYGDLGLQPLPTFKFAGGWCTLLSNDLLRHIPIPESFGHYGMEDTYITEVCKFLHTTKTLNVVQFSVTNLLVGELYKHRCNEHMKRFVVSRNRKEEFRTIATNNFEKEYNNFMLQSMRKHHV